MTKRRRSIALHIALALAATLASAKAQVETHEVTVGKGEPAIQGALVAICFESRLTDGTQVSSNKGKSPLVFSIGSSEVLVGLSDGVEGMREGGVRQVLIPSRLAYGTVGHRGKVPPNADLQYFIRLRFVGEPGTESSKQRRDSEEVARKRIAELSPCVFDPNELEGLTEVGRD